MRAKGRNGEVEDPMQAWRHSERESGEPETVRWEDGQTDRSGKSKDESR